MMTTTRAADAELSRKAILDATERLMVEQGYAAVSSRRVAAKAGVKPSLVHYYYKTTDDLLIALYRRANQESLHRLTKALSADEALQELWKLSMDPVRTVLVVELLALANHRPAVRSEIALVAERFRSMQAGALARTFRDLSLPPNVDIARGVSVLLAGAARVLVMEAALGITAGHDDAQAIVEWLIQRLGGQPSEPAATERA